MSWRVSLLGGYRFLARRGPPAAARIREARSVIPDTTPHDMEGGARGGTVVKK